MHIERSIDIAAPPTVVWAVMVDVVRWREWTESITSIELLDAGAFGVGSRARVRQPRFPAALWRVTEFEPGRSFAWESKTIGARTVGTHRVVANASGGSTATLAVRSAGFLVPLVRPFVQGISERYVEMEAQGLKRRCESAAR
jgi:hypothetical protein